MCVVNKQFELLEFVSDSIYVDMQYDEISLTYLDLIYQLDSRSQNMLKIVTNTCIMLE